MNEVAKLLANPRLAQTARASQPATGASVPGIITLPKVDADTFETAQEVKERRLGQIARLLSVIAIGVVITFCYFTS